MLIRASFLYFPIVPSISRYPGTPVHFYLVLHPNRPPSWLQRSIIRHYRADTNATGYSDNYARFLNRYFSVYPSSTHQPPFQFTQPGCRHGQHRVIPPPCTRPIPLSHYLVKSIPHHSSVDQTTVRQQSEGTGDDGMIPAVLAVGVSVRRMGIRQI